MLLPFCAGVQFSSRSHRALIDRKKHEKIEGCEQSIIEGKGQAFLGRETATKLKVLHLSENVVVNVLKQEFIFDKYKSCFEGLGKLKTFQLDISIDQNVKSVAQSMRRVPFSF